MYSLKRIFHYGPLATLGMMKVITGATIYCNAKWWPPADSLGGALNSLLFFVFSSMTAINFFTAVFDGPGFLPQRWQPPDNNTQYLQYCDICLGYKAPRSHHCRKCHRCVLKMDHHCPWINGCVGHQNQGHFILFIFFAVCGCLQSVIVLSCTLQQALRRGWYFHQFHHNMGNGFPGIHLGLFGLLLAVFALGIAIGVVLAVGILLYLQLRSLARNRTAIEEWILEKAARRRLVAKLRGENVEPFVFPYNLGTWENIKQVLNWHMKPDGDGITWKIRSHPPCDQYTLTKEQIEQKTLKRQRARGYLVIKNYSGSWFPISFGYSILLNPPFTDEDRLPLSVGDYVRVTRMKKYWFFGEKRNEDDTDYITKGWFPRPCVIEITGGMGDVVHEESKKDI